jgi:hypothetical protein
MYNLSRRFVNFFDFEKVLFGVSLTGGSIDSQGKVDYVFGDQYDMYFVGNAF